VDDQEHFIAARRQHRDQGCEAGVWFLERVHQVWGSNPGYR